MKRGVPFLVRIIVFMLGRYTMSLRSLTVFVAALTVAVSVHAAEKEKKQAKVEPAGEVSWAT